MKEEGMVLVTALLFLLVLTLLTTSLLNTSLLESKMSRNYQDKILALQDAELNLKHQEHELQQAQKMTTNICGVTFYKIIATGVYHRAISKVESIFAVLGDVHQCKIKPQIKAGQQSWLELE